MRVSINEQGLMYIESETPLEAYALKQWSEANFEYDKEDSKILAYRVKNIIISAVVKE